MFGCVHVWSVSVWSWPWSPPCPVPSSCLPSDLACSLRVLCETLTSPLRVRVCNFETWIMHVIGLHVVSVQLNFNTSPRDVPLIESLFSQKKRSHYLHSQLLSSFYVETRKPVSRNHEFVGSTIDEMTPTWGPITGNTCVDVIVLVARRYHPYRLHLNRRYRPCVLECNSCCYV